MCRCCYAAGGGSVGGHASRVHTACGDAAASLRQADWGKEEKVKLRSFFQHSTRNGRCLYTLAILYSRACSLSRKTQQVLCSTRPGSCRMLMASFVALFDGKKRWDEKAS